MKGCKEYNQVRVQGELTQVNFFDLHIKGEI